MSLFLMIGPSTLKYAGWSVIINLSGNVHGPINFLLRIPPHYITPTQYCFGFNVCSPPPPQYPLNIDLFVHKQNENDCEIRTCSICYPFHLKVIESFKGGDMIDSRDFPVNYGPDCPYILSPLSWVDVQYFCHKITINARKQIIE